MAPSFGTDGVRGLANEALTPDVALALGRAAAEVLGCDRFVVGRDPRRSGPMLEAALVAGICSAGADVAPLGLVPTPTVAWASADGGAAGAMISASHNPFGDNGIKLFAPGGLKLSDDVEASIEAAYRQLLSAGIGPGPTGPAIGTILERSAATAEGWMTTIRDSIAPRNLERLTIVVDCANGAASGLGPKVYTDLGATVEVIGD